MSFFLLLSNDLVAINDGLDNFKVVRERSQVGYFAWRDTAELFVDANGASRVERCHAQDFVESDIRMFDQIAYTLNHG